MNRAKFFLFALAGLFMAACTTDNADKSSDNSAAEAIALKKVVNTSENAKSGEMIIYVDEATASQLEGATEATRSGVSALDAAMAELGAISVKPVFNMLVNAEFRIFQELKHSLE